MFVAGIATGFALDKPNVDADDYAHHKYVYGFAAGYCAHHAGEDGANLEAVERCIRDYLYTTGQGDTWERFNDS